MKKKRATKDNESTIEMYAYLPGNGSYAQSDEIYRRFCPFSPRAPVASQLEEIISATKVPATEVTSVSAVLHRHG